MELIHAEQITAEVTGRSHKGPGARTVVAAIMVLAIAGAATAFAASGMDLGRSAASEVSGIDTEESTVCRSGEVLQGLIKPHECAAFGRECTPRNPLGATMVSSEGACAAYYLYRRLTLLEPDPTTAPREVAGV